LVLQECLDEPGLVLEILSGYLTTLNRSNENLALTDTQIEHFLKSQHSLGKILYLDQHGFKKFIIVQPQSLVQGC
jgi:hypothetical protein